MKFKSLSLVLLASLSISHTIPVSGMNLSYKNTILAAGATLASIGLGKIAYDYFTQLTDAQEFDQAMNLCEQVEQLIMDTDCGVSLYPLKETYYPLYAYVHNLEALLSQYARLEDKLSATKIHVWERRGKLIIAVVKVSAAEAIPLKSSIEAYDFALEELQSSLLNLILKRKELQALHAQLIEVPQYQSEKQQVRIEELEEKLRKARIYALFSNTRSTHHCWPTSSPIYIHNTPIIHHSSTAPDMPTDKDIPCCPAPAVQPEPSDLLPNVQNLPNDAWRDRFYDLGNNFNG